MSDLPSIVLWLGGIAGIVGFLLGSVRWHNEIGASKYDTFGAIICGAAGAMLVGGVTDYYASDEIFSLVTASLGASMLVLRFFALTGVIEPKIVLLPEGISRIAGGYPREKFEAAEKLFYAAAFQKNGYYATRSEFEWRFDETGIPASFMTNTAKVGVALADLDDLDIVVLLVRELPNELYEPGVVVIRGIENVRKILVEADGFTPPGMAKIPSSSIAGVVTYGWRDDDIS